MEDARAGVDCTPCAAGRQPNAKQTSCDLCPAGRYSADGLRCKACWPRSVEVSGALSSLARFHSD
jgi:hypothetical protein